MCDLLLKKILLGPIKISSLKLGKTHIYAAITFFGKKKIDYFFFYHPQHSISQYIFDCFYRIDYG